MIILRQKIGRYILIPGANNLRLVWPKLAPLLGLILFFSCQPKQAGEEADSSPIKQEVVAATILGNPDYLALSYGGYRQNSRDIQPTVEQVKEDLKILAAMNIKVLRTYNTKLKHASTVLAAQTP